MSGATGIEFPNYATSGSIGTAVDTVDIYSRININQTTPSISLTVPPPTNTSTKVTEVWIGNIGSVSFDLDIGAGISIKPFHAIILKWAGSEYYIVGSNSESSGNVEQFEVVNPSIISSGGIEVWEFDNTLYDKYAQCALYDESTNLRLTAIANKVTDTKIAFTFYTGVDIDAGAYRACIQGVQKEEPPVEEGFTYTFPFTLI